MPFINISSRKKRGRSSRIFFPSRKVRIVDNDNFDGTHSPQEGFKDRFRRKGSRALSLLGISSKDDRATDDVSFHPIVNCSSAGDETSSTIVRSRSQHSRRHSSSGPGITHRLSHKISSTFGHPTVVHRTSLRSRPSVRSIQEGLEPLRLDDPASPQDNSASSTYYTCTWSSPAPVSTNPTTDSISTSPMRSPTHQLSFLDNSRIITLPSDVPASRLAPISETSNVVIPSIITVEATATAKIFFETHFRHLLASHRPRSQRRQELERVLETCNWSHAQRHKARAAFMRQENEFLRQDRVLNSKANTMKQAKGVSIAGYEVVKVLGKGSFGVVRLVKEKVQPQTDAPVVTDVESKKRTKTDMASLKLTAREALPLLGYRRKELTKLKKEVYAMKVIRKSEMLRNSQEGHLRAERDFLVASENSRWIVPLIAAFQDNRHLYLVMDYCVGGDFLGLLIRKNTLSEDATRWYIAEMILCVEEAHALRWIHRDVKPDNFLISASGHLKISDFGLAFDGNWSHDQAFFHDHRHSLLEKLGIEVQGDEQDKAEAEATQASQNIGKVMAGRLQPSNTEKSAKVVEEPAEDEPVVDWRDRNQRRKLARSVVGTSQYMAPEVIRGELYDGRCDWWSIGIILYECLFGFTPFACENRQETKLKILKHTTTLCFPDDQQGFPPISSDVLDLMKRLLREKEDRLSSPKYILNDYAHTQEDHNTYRIHGAAHRSSKNYQGKHVYPEDADDIKAHPWFRNTDWTSIHKKKPPFIPRVKGWEDTKYFDDDEPVSDIDSSSEDEEVEPTPIAEKENLIGPSKQDHDHAITGHHPEDQHIIPSTNTTYTKLLNNTSPLQPPLDGGAATNGKTPTTFKKPKREKKRPRDKILRDPKTAKIALDMRLKGAFLGYSYRRPKGVQSVLERVEAEVEIEIEGLNSLIDGCYNCGVEGGEGGCGRRDSAIAGIEMVGGGGGQREIVREGGRGIEPVGIPGLQAKGPGGNGNPSPRCSTPVENGMGMDGPNQRSGMM